MIPRESEEEGGRGGGGRRGGEGEGGEAAVDIGGQIATGVTHLTQLVVHRRRSITAQVHPELSWNQWSGAHHSAL